MVASTLKREEELLVFTLQDLQSTKSSASQGSLRNPKKSESKGSLDIPLLSSALLLQSAESESSTIFGPPAFLD